MATLHVRNVPDDLYELLRVRATANDRSIGAETVQLLQERLALTSAGRPPRRFPMPGRRRVGAGLFTRFTEEARAAVVEAEERARSFGRDHVGTEHLLLGVLGCGEGTPLAQGLETLGVTLARVEQEVERSPGEVDAPVGGRIPFEPASKEALELALREALTLRHDAIAPGHVLLGIVRQETGRGAEILRTIEPDASKLRDCIVSGWNPAAMHLASGFQMTPMPSFRVVLLEGNATDWETQLNAAAAQGYDLLEIVDKRAILRRV